MKKKDIKELQKELPELPAEYHCVCDTCGCSWYDYHDYNEYTYCPKCGSAEVYVYGEDDDNF